ncbi:MAG: caspase family protein [Phormidesmis sp.]
MTAAAKMTINPEQVSALIVGIEAYQLGGDYDLDGPARDGWRFIEWLLSRGVLPRRIHFFASPLAQNDAVKAQAKQSGIRCLPATRDAIDKYIRDELQTACGEVLYVFWGGHGILTKTEQATRQLLFADTTATNKLNLNVDSLQQALATSTYGEGFAKQLLVVDACANRYFQNLYEVIQGKAGEHQYGSSGEAVLVEQAVMFACEAYDVAKNIAGTGVFSSAVLAELTDQPLFPDMQALMNRVSDRLSQKGMPEPYYLWTKFGNQEIVRAQRGRAARADTSLQADPTGIQQLKAKRIQHQLERAREQHEAESELLGETSGAVDAQRQQTVERLEKKIAELEIKLKEAMP